LTGSGAAVLVAVTLDWVGEATMVETVTELLPRFGSPTVLETVAVAEMVVPAATPELTLTTRGKLTLAPAARLPVRVHVTVPVTPTAGVVQDQPEGTGARE